MIAREQEDQLKEEKKKKAKNTAKGTKLTGTKSTETKKTKLTLKMATRTCPSPIREQPIRTAKQQPKTTKKVQGNKKFIQTKYKY